MSDMRLLFQRNPAEWEEKDYDQAIREFRDSRKFFNLGSQNAGSNNPKTAEGRKKKNLQIALDKELDLEL